MEPTDVYDYSERDGLMDPLPASPEVNYNWVDITAEFLTSIKELEMGELLHDKLFGLFEAMSAIEMMDPKMDAGMLCNRGTTKPLTFSQAVQAGKLKLEGLSASELIGIIDATYSCIVSWLEGHSLAQTVFTCLYLHQPQDIKDKTLRAFALAVYKILDLIRKYIIMAQVFEEEDFQPYDYGFRLGGSSQGSSGYNDMGADVTEQRCVAALREQEDELHKKYRNNTQEAEALLGLFARIKLTRMFYQTLCLLPKRDQHSINDCNRLLTSCSEMMLIVNKTVDKGTQPEENSDMPNPMGFEPLVNQRLLPPTFPRYTRIKPRRDALNYIQDLLTNLKHAMKITNITSFHTVLDFFMEFSKGQPCILSRSALQILYLGSSDNPINVVPDSLKEAIKAFNNPPVFIARYQLLNNVQVREYVETFLSRCARPFTALLQVCGHNRARQRDKLAHLLDDFAALQEEAETIDGFLFTLSLKSLPESGRRHLPCFTTWILYHVLRIMIMYLLSGLELELYSVHEYHYIFWYLYEYLYGWLASALSRADSIASEQEALCSGGSSQGGVGGCGVGGGRRGGSKPPKHKRRQGPRATQREALLCQIMTNMCGGYYKALVAFQLQGKIKQPSSEFDSEAVRYKHRFAPLSLSTPPQVQYAAYGELTQPLRYEKPSTLYLAGCKHFQQARACLESMQNPDQEILDLVKVAKTNFVVLKLLAGGHKNDSTTPPDFDFSHHRHFPIIRLV